MPAGQSSRSSIDTMMPNHPWFPVAAPALVCKVTKDRLSVRKNNRDMVLPDELDDLSRFEEEGGPEAPIPDLQEATSPITCQVEPFLIVLLNASLVTDGFVASARDACASRPPLVTTASRNCRQAHPARGSRRQTGGRIHVLKWLASVVAETPTLNRPHIVWSAPRDPKRR